MPAGDFTQPTVTDGTLVDHVVTPGTIHNKNWWDNTLFAWILGMVKSSSYPSTTPADLTEKVMQGNLTPPLYIESEDTHTDSASADSTRVFVKASMFAINLGTSQFYAGGWAELGVGGNCIVAAFSNADYYKKIAIGLAEVANVLTLKITESAEAVSIGALGEPAAYGGTWTQLGTLIVQNDGTVGTAGKILDIEQADITSFGMTVIPREPYVPITVKSKGPIVVGDIDVPEAIPFDGTIISCSLFCADTGTGAGDGYLYVDININGVSVFTTPANRPTLVANTGTNQVDITLAADMDNATTFSSGDYIAMEVDMRPTDSEDISCTLWVLPDAE